MADFAAMTGAPKTQEDWERSARALVDEGQNFLAHDLCRDGLKLFPASVKLAVYGAISLSQTGAVDEARRLLAPILEDILIDEGPFRRLQAALKTAIATLDHDHAEGALGAIADLAEAMEMVRGKKLEANADSETYYALARVFREAWLASGRRGDLAHCRQLFLRAFAIGANPRDGIDAAVMSVLLGDQDQARALAARVIGLLEGWQAPTEWAADDVYRTLSTLAQAQLLQDDGAGAIATFQRARALEGVHYGRVVSSLKQIELLRQGGIAVPDAVADIIRSPTVVVFTGHALDRPDEGPHFPAALESAVKAEIAARLEELDAQIGYSTAACGSDLLFIEAMLERGAEVNVVMPFAIDDFIAADVRYGGARWEMRFRNALKLAASVTYATEERYLGHDMLYRFANQCLHGLATLRAGFLHTSPYLLAVWDMMPGSLVGGAGDFIDQWEDISRLRIIDLDDLVQRHPDLCPDGPALPNLTLDEGDDEEGQGRVIRSMLFCDIAGYSKLKEEHIPDFLDFLGRLKDGLTQSGIEPKSINTWGDAIFVVMDKATPMAEYALTMQEVVARLAEEMRPQLPNPLTLRISLHAGPVFEAEDPIRGTKNFYGSHINRAARLEPVTVIGHVYATQQFVAVLTAEQSAQRAEMVSNGQDFVPRFVCEYVGVLSLAKDFGRQTVYHLRRHVAGETPEALPPEEAREVLASGEANGEMPGEDAPEAAAGAAPAPAIDEPGITETPMPTVEAMLRNVAKLVDPAATTRRRPRKGKGEDKLEDVMSKLADDLSHWPGG